MYLVNVIRCGRYAIITFNEGGELGGFFVSDNTTSFIEGRGSVDNFYCCGNKTMLPLKVLDWEPGTIINGASA